MTSTLLILRLLSHANNLGIFVQDDAVRHSGHSETSLDVSAGLGAEVRPPRATGGRGRGSAVDGFSGRAKRARRGRKGSGAHGHGLGGGGREAAHDGGRHFCW